MPQLDFETWLDILYDMDLFSIMFYLIVLLCVVMNVCRVLYIRKSHDEWVSNNLQTVLVYFLNTFEINEQYQADMQKMYMINISKYFLYLLDTRISQTFLQVSFRQCQYNFDLLVTFMVSLINQLAFEKILLLKNTKGSLLKFDKRISKIIKKVPFMSSFLVSNNILVAFKDKVEK